MESKKISNRLQTAYIRRYELTDGKEAGLKVIELNNGIIRVLLNESKALDVMQLWYKGLNMSFVSKNGFIFRELPFEQRFEGGMVYTCGLDSLGERDGFEPHGSFHTNPAQVYSVCQDDEKLEIKAVVEDTVISGKSLTLSRRITVPVGSGTLRVEDILLNSGTKTEDYCLLYHINLGYPMLDEGVLVNVQADSVIPRTDYAAKNMHNRTVFAPVKDNEEEYCFFIKDAGENITVINEKINTKLTLTYSKQTLPNFVQWNSPATQEYALGLEPATSFLDDGFTYKQIEPGQSIPFFVNLSFEEI